MSDAFQEAPHLGAMWHAGRVTFGGWCSIGDPFVAELMGRSGFDWICLDMQHGLIGPDRLMSMLQATDAAGVPALVRVPDSSAQWIGRALDLGADGVIVPMVETADQAAAVIGAMQYAPRGRRSWGPTRASLRTPNYGPTQADSRAVAVLMIETQIGVEQVEQIMATPGIDAVFIGPADLALSEGESPTSPGAFTARSIDAVVAAGRRQNVPVGIFCQNMSEVERYLGAGLPMIAVMSDVRLLRQAAAEALSTASLLAMQSSVGVGQGRVS